MALALAKTGDKSNALEIPVYEKMARAAKDAFLQVCNEQTWLTEVSFALQIIGGNQYLQNVCKTVAGAQSITNAIINVAMTGTTLNPVLKKAYLVPRSVNNVMMCCLDFSYQGLAGIAIDSGSVKHIGAYLVYSFDDFEYEMINGEVKFRHKPSLDPPEDFVSGPDKFWDYVQCGYCVATLYDGSKQIFPPFLKWKLKKAMTTSKTSGANTPWRTHPDEMSLKTIIKHEYKHLPQTDRMSQAVSLLNEHEGIETEADRKTRGASSSDVFDNNVHDADFTEIQKGTTEGSASPNEPTMDMLITPEQADEILRKVEEYGVNFDSFLSFLGVKNLADLPQSCLGTAHGALEAKRQQNGAAPGRSAGAGERPAVNNINDVATALTAKNISYQMDEEMGIVQVKLSFNETANKDFVKSLGFKWDPQDKVWTWSR